jgi:hypothetical protein
MGELLCPEPKTIQRLEKNTDILLRKTRIVTCVVCEWQTSRKTKLAEEGCQLGREKDLMI